MNHTIQIALIEYLKMRRESGAKLKAAQWILTKFVAFLQQRKAEAVTTALAQQWIEQLGIEANSKAGYMAYIRQFAHFLSKRDSRTEIPPYEIYPAISRASKAVRVTWRKNPSSRPDWSSNGAAPIRNEHHNDSALAWTRIN